MTIQTHNVVAESPAPSGKVSVLDAYPGSLGVGITATSEGVNLEQITAFIARGAGRLNAMLENHGMDPDDLGSNETALIQSGIIAYAVSRTLHKVGRHEDAAPYDEEWKETIEILRTYPDEMGEAREDAPGPRSNLTNKTRKWGENFKGW